jgi:hypothetical protein
MGPERDDYADPALPSPEDRLASVVALIGILFAPGLVIIAILVLTSSHYR